MIRNRRIGSATAIVRTKPNTALHLVQSSRFSQKLGRWLIITLFVAIAAMMLLPWQQTSRGAGQVIALDPQERQQSIESPVKGVVAKIREGLQDGSKVKKGDILVEIEPFAANMQLQLDEQIRSLNAKLYAERQSIEAYGRNIVDNTEAAESAVLAAQQMVQSAKAKLESKRNQVPGYESKVWQARQNYERQNSLFERGLKPAKDIEKLKKEFDMATAELASLGEDIESLTQDLEAKKNQVNEKRSSWKTKVDYSRAQKQGAQGKAETILKEIADVQMKLGELARMAIPAPRDGTILRMEVSELNRAVKAGESLMIFVPDTTQKVVELYINGNDLPLVQLGQEVRLQFEGWPAVQLPGWPSIAIGTFSGEVITIDATDNGKGEFRILVLPNEESKNVSTLPSEVEKLNPRLDWLWPKEEDRYLRQGTRANGWVMMQRVSLGYEIWRQINGFPIMLGEDHTKEKKGAKPPKLPK